MEEKEKKRNGNNRDKKNYSFAFFFDSPCSAVPFDWIIMGEREKIRRNVRYLSNKKQREDQQTFGMVLDSLWLISSS